MIDKIDTEKTLQELFEKVDKLEYQSPFHESVNMTDLVNKFETDITIIELTNRMIRDAANANGILQRMGFLSKEKFDLNFYNPHDMSLTILEYSMLKCPDRNGFQIARQIISQTTNLFWAVLL